MSAQLHESGASAGGRRNVVGVGRDLRLFPVVAAIWLSCLAGLYHGVWEGAVTAGVAAVAGIVIAVWLRGRGAHRPLAGLVLGVLLGVVCGASSTAARVAVRDSSAVSSLAARHAIVHVRLSISDDPHQARGHGPGPVLYVVPARANELAGVAGQRVRGSVDLLVFATDPAWNGLLPGTPVNAYGHLSAARPGELTAALLSASGPPQVVGQAPWAQRAAGALRAGLRRACRHLPEQPGGLLPGLVIGDTSGLDPALAAQFRVTGMTHLLAVSGANVAIVLSAVLLLARLCRAGPRGAAVVCGIALVGFVILARPSPSVIRAAAMGGIALVALALGRARAALPALAAATGVLLVVEPQLANSAGFALSVFATAGLLLLAPPWSDQLRRLGVPPALAEALAIPAAAQVACAPVIAGISGTISLVAVPANLLVEPAVAPATIAGVVAALLSVVWPGAALVGAWCGAIPAWWLVLVARYGAAAPDAVAAWPGGAGGALLLAALLGVALLAGRHPAVRVVAGVCAVAAALGAVPVRLLLPGWPPADPLLVACDVNQGDAIVLPVRPGVAIVIDAGPEPVATDHCLTSLHVSDVALFVVSHFHADHVDGLAGLYRGRRVEAIITAPFREPVGGYDLVTTVASRHGTPVSVPPPGASYRIGRVRLDVLGPVARIADTTSDPNNNSLVLRAEVDGERILLLGDAQTEEQAQILAAVGPDGVRAQILKVAHHGSAFQDPALLAAVHPAIALVSVGVHNPYGHPNAALLASLSSAGATVLRTDRDGDVAAALDHGGLVAMRHGVPPTGHPP